jgi:hypothetical protein
MLTAEFGTSYLRLGVIDVIDKLRTFCSITYFTAASDSSNGSTVPHK